MLQGYRAQIDRLLYKEHLQKEIYSTKNLTIRADPVEDLLVDGNVCLGVLTGQFSEIFETDDEVWSLIFPLNEL